MGGQRRCHAARHARLASPLRPIQKPGGAQPSMNIHISRTTLYDRPPAASVLPGCGHQSGSGDAPQVSSSAIGLNMMHARDACAGLAIPCSMHAPSQHTSAKAQVPVVGARAPFGQRCSAAAAGQDGWCACLWVCCPAQIAAARAPDTHP